MGGAPKPAGTPCDDGRKCTTGDVCDGKGICGGTQMTCPPSADACHTAGTCSETNGTCPAPAVVPDGTPCNDGNLCTTDDSCQIGRASWRGRVQSSGAAASFKKKNCDTKPGPAPGIAPKRTGTASSV